MVALPTNSIGDPLQDSKSFHAGYSSESEVGYDVYTVELMSARIAIQWPRFSFTTSHFLSLTLLVLHSKLSTYAVNQYTNAN